MARVATGRGAVPTKARMCGEAMSGHMCPHPVPQGAPVALCEHHLRLAFAWVVKTDGLSIWRRKAYREQVIYFIRFSDRIKIGTSGSVDSRLAGLPHDEVLGVVRGDEDGERALHQRFAAHRIGNTEWFHDHPEIRDFITRCVANERRARPTPDDPRGGA